MRRRPHYCSRRNAGTGRWILYFLDRGCYRIMGSADTMPNAIASMFE